MKKLLIASLGLSLLASVSMFAQNTSTAGTSTDTMSSSSGKKHHKKMKKGTSSSTTTTAT